MKLPDFIIAGAARSGTTWLYEVLDKHPDIYLAKPVKPEPKFFLVDELYSKGIEEYKKKWFGNYSIAKFVGEKSTNYLEGTNVATRIQQHLPDVKLIFSLRDPVERAFSNYLWSCFNGLEKESFSNAIDLEKYRERTYSDNLKHSRPFSYYSRGLYFKLLTPYFNLFPRYNILCVKFEDIVKNPGDVMYEICKFIGVEYKPDLENKVSIVNSARKGNESMGKNIRQVLMNRYAPENHKLKELLGEECQVWHE